MNYDFTTMLDRRGRDSIAADQFCGLSEQLLLPGFEPLPMWVADMNFATAPTVTQALLQRAAHPSFGYFDPSDAYYDAILAWQREGNGVQGLERAHIGYENGVLGGITSALRVLCSDGDPVLLHSPAYNGFTSQLEKNGYRAVLSPLQLDEDQAWRMDFADMERKLREHRIHTALLCSPHNPTGRVWERWELERAMELFRAYDVYVISDEIWSDLTLFGCRHIPTQSLSEDARSRTAAFYSPSKTFNLAGLVGSYRIVYSGYLRDRLDRYESLCHYNDMNVLSMHALIGAYQPEGRRWLEELKAVLEENMRYACGFVQQRFDGVRFSRPQGTYVLLLDCAQWCREHALSGQELHLAGVRVGVLWQKGSIYHVPCGVRLNLALPRDKLAQALDRLDRYVFHPERA